MHADALTLFIYLLAIRSESHRNDGRLTAEIFFMGGIYRGLASLLFARHLLWCLLLLLGYLVRYSEGLK